MRNVSCAIINCLIVICIDGTIALVVLDGVSLIKRVDICEDYINLVSLNPKYDDIKVASFSDIKVMGKVVL
ncbi:TPA: hypothetical protein PDJ74_001310 [Staphylococcus aureus]|nr:hypothetical protein [Staphylococcus aureus]